MTRITGLPSPAALDRMQREAEIKAIKSNTFKTYCQGIAILTPIIVPLLGMVIKYLFT